MTEALEPGTVWPDQPEWPPGDPRWQARQQGWLEGYRAGQLDQLARLDIDKLILERVAEILAGLRA